MELLDNLSSSVLLSGYIAIGGIGAAFSP